MPYYNFDQIKKSISLCDFLIENFGWTFDEGSSTRNPKLKSPTTSDVIVIRHSPKGFDTYFSVHDDSIKGATIFDWMAKHIEEQTGKRPSLSEVGEILQGFIYCGKTKLPHDYGDYKTTADGKEMDETEIFLNEVHKVRPMTDFSFLENRGIKRETLDDPIWQNIFKQKSFTKNEATYNNMVVLMYNRKGVAGISQRGVNFKGAIGHRDDSLAISRIVNREVQLYIGESMIDCISHYQIRKDEGKDMSHAQYLSTEGQITEGQIKYIYDVLNASDSKLQILKFTPIFDNDPAGQSYTFKLLGNISENGYKYTAQVSNDKLHVIFTANNPQEIDTLFPKRIFDKYTTDFQIDIRYKIGNVTIYDIEFPMNKELIKELNCHIGAINLGERFALELPVSKDFNDDLQKG